MRHPPSPPSALLSLLLLAPLAHAAPTVLPLPVDWYPESVAAGRTAACTSAAGARARWRG